MVFMKSHFHVLGNLLAFRAFTLLLLFSGKEQTGAHSPDHAVADVLGFAEIDFQRQLLCARYRNIDRGGIRVAAEVGLYEYLASVDAHAAQGPTSFAGAVVEADRGFEFVVLLVQRVGQDASRVHGQRAGRLFAF